MTSFLRINGINVPIANDSAVLSQEDIGSNHRAVDGTPVYNRRATKRKWSFKLTPQLANTALAFRDLITGKGHTLQGIGVASALDQLGIYTSKGLAPNSVGASFYSRYNAGKFALVSPPYGTAAINLAIGWVAGYTAVYPLFTSTAVWTISWWSSTDNGTTYHHHVLTSTGVKYLDGSVSVVAITDLSVTSGSMTIGSGTATIVCDFHAWPFIIPIDWPAQMYAFCGTGTGIGGPAFGALPRLNADGAFIEQNSIISCIGEAGDLKALQGYPSGTLVQNMHDFVFSLMEV